MEFDFRIFARPHCRNNGLIKWLLYSVDCLILLGRPRWTCGGDSSEIFCMGRCWARNLFALSARHALYLQSPQKVIMDKLCTNESKSWMAVASWHLHLLVEFLKFGQQNTKQPHVYPVGWPLAVTRKSCQIMLALYGAQPSDWLAACYTWHK